MAGKSEAVLPVLKPPVHKKLRGRGKAPRVLNLGTKRVNRQLHSLLLAPTEYDRNRSESRSGSESTDRNLSSVQDSNPGLPARSQLL